MPSLAWRSRGLTPPQSYNTAKNLCTCQGWEGLAPASGDQLLLLWSAPCAVVLCLSVVEKKEAGRWTGQSSERYCWALVGDQSENPSTLPLLTREVAAFPEPRGSCEVQPQTLFTLVGEEERGQRAANAVVKRAWATGAKAGTFKAGQG